jgi:tetratricopeptide (TPR) repeat protein
LVERNSTSKKAHVYQRATLGSGEILRFAGRYEEAATAYIEVLARMKKRGSEPLIYVLLWLTNALVAMKKWAEALEYGLEAKRALTRELSSPDTLSETYRLLADAYEGLGIEDGCGRCNTIAMVAAKQADGHTYYFSEISYTQRHAKRCMREGRYAEAEISKTNILKWYTHPLSSRCSASWWRRSGRRGRRMRRGRWSRIWTRRRPL